MKHFSTILILILSLRFASAAYDSGYDFHHFIASSDGLSFDDVKCIVQDTRSNIWAGTRYGLNRYDGTAFKTYFKNDMGVLSDFIRCLYAAPDGNIWIGTSSGLAMYDSHRDVFVNPLKEAKEQIMCIVPDYTGNLWFGEEDGVLLKRNGKNGEFKKYDFAQIVRSTSLVRMAINRKNELYICAYCDNIYYFDSATETLIPVDLGNYSDFFKGDDVGGIVFSHSSNDIAYVLGKRSGLCEVDLRKRTVKILYTSGSNQKFTNIRLDSEDNLWLASTYGLVKYSIKTGQYSCFSSQKDDKFSLSDNNVTFSMEDNQGNLWVASNSGLNCASSNQSRFHKYYMTDDGVSLEMCNIKGAVQDKAGMVWIASEKIGLLAFKPEEGTVAAVGEKYSLPEITSICADENDLWLGTRAGIYKMNPITGVKKHYLNLEGADFRVLSLLKLNSGDIIAGTTGGLMHYDNLKDQFERFSGIDCNNADVLAQDSFGTVWIATYSDGVYAFDPEKEICTGHYYESGMPKAMSSVTVDSATDGVWAMSFGSGFFRFERESGTFTCFDKVSIPSLPSNIFFSALADQNGILWLATDKGVVGFNPSRMTVRCLGIADGLLDEIYSPVALKLVSGDLLFASRNGFVTFNPVEILERNKPVHAVISGVSTVEGPIIPGPDSAFDENADSAEEFHFSAQQNSIFINLATPGSLFSPCVLYTKLSDVDSTLREVPPSGLVCYYDLPYGHYTMQFLSRDPSGQEYEVHKSVKITIDPPFWMSGTGITIIAFLVAFAIALIIALAIRNIRRKQERELHAFQKARDEEMMEEKMNFFSNIIHEIKTPLTLIRTPLKNLISMEEVPDNAKNELKIIENSSDSMDKLVKELLEFIKIEKSGYVLTKRNVDIVDRIGFLCFNFSDTAKAGNLSLDFIHEDESLTVAVDYKAMEKVFSNLLHNALKYAESKIVVEECRQDGNVLVKVSNDGPSIPNSQRSEIFKPFVQFSSDRAPYTQSFGIGLALAKTLAEAHGGSLELSEGERTEFVLTLPLYVIPEALESENPSQTSPQNENATVLVVEDNLDLLDYLKSKLSDEYNIIAVNSAEAALKVLSEKVSVSLVLTDIGLVHMSGVELCGRICSDFMTSHIPVVVISAISSESTKIKCMESGAALYIEKPFTIDYLLACVRGILEKREQLKKVYGMSGTTDLSSFNIEDRDSEFLSNLESVVMHNICDEAFSVKQLETELCMSHTALYKKMIGLLNTSPVEYIKTKRLSLAAQLIRQNGAMISEVCYKVGFTSPSYFTKCFRETIGMTPSEYARKYSHQQ